MARKFEVFENPSPRLRDFAPFVMVLQSHYLEGLPSTIVAPLLSLDSAQRFVHITLDVEVEGETLVLSLQEMAAVDVRGLRRKVANLEAYQDAIDRALQRLFSGF